MPHGHSHGNGCSHEASGINNPLEMGIEYSLFKKIDLENMECLNEEIENSGKSVFKPFEKRLDFTEYVKSDADEELLFNIPFTGNVKLKGIIIIGDDDDTHPSKVRLFKNRQKMSFDDTTSSADQEFELSRDTSGQIEYATKIVTFATVHHLSLHFPSNFGSEYTKINYIGLRGEFTEAHDHGVTICNYEIRPNVSDHKNNLFNQVNHQIQ
ncbi:PITH domain-containing protein CG6153 [Condylostylus longicornis]|uniref:PITH domain-containing protein CG6153 n=1 Tax=Condylostylus longicornis TaxID=2530218 RepID=UPI00244DFFAB|nr:PITH domain-containing protein CG6153 [Condylostylus longicornis]